MIITLKITILGTAANNKVTLIIAPSYTSHNQEWNGAAPTLNKKAIKINKIPQKRNEFDEAFAKQSKDSNEVEPKEMYIKENPSNNKQEITAPKTKYFKPLSVENSELRLNVAKT